MKVFERLYTLDSKGKVRIFEITIDEESYQNKESDTIDIITKTGLLGGKLISQKERVKHGKQKRDIQDQAEFQANALWESKLDEGYKSLSMLLEASNINDEQDLLVNEEEAVKRSFERHPQAACTNKNWDELCMLAHKYKDIKKPSFPYFAQPKLNGVRCLSKLTDITKPVKLISRGGSYYDIPHIQRQLFDLHIKVRNEFGEDVIFDGEIYKHGVPLQQISGAARTESTGLFNSNDWLEYHIYDIIFGVKKVTQNTRSLYLNQLQQILPFSNIKIVKSTLVNNQKEVDEIYEQFINDGYEGAILRNPNAAYEFNQRSRNLLKVKLFQDEEFEIIGYKCNPDKIEESFVFTLINNINNLIFDARPTGTAAMKKNWYSNMDTWMNKKATVKFFERTVDGLPSHAHLMHKQSECLVIHIRPKGE